MYRHVFVVTGFQWFVALWVLFYRFVYISVSVKLFIHTPRTSWKIHAVNVLSSLFLFRVLYTQLHIRWVGQHPNRSSFGWNRSNSGFHRSDTVFLQSKMILRLVTLYWSLHVASDIIFFRKKTVNFSFQKITICNWSYTYFEMENKKCLTQNSNQRQRTQNIDGMDFRTAGERERDRGR